jgi:UPF0716 protein FxsA
LPFLLFFVLLPLVEIALFIAVGAQIGVGATLALIVLSALLGVTILRGQQARAVQMMQGGLRVAPGTFLAQGAFRAFSGILLILPGFLTDVIGLVLLIPALQRAIVRMIGAGATVATATVWQEGDIVEGDYEVREPGGETVYHTHRIDDLRRP